MMLLKDWINDSPCCFNRVLTSEKSSISGHGVAQEQLVR
jgi:hypothetical protein